MATIHLEEIQRILLGRGEMDAETGASGGSFLEIRFDKPGSRPNGVVDEEYQNRVITADSPYGLATIYFDEEGQLRSIDFC